MEKIVKEGKIFEEVLNEILVENNLKEKDIVYKKSLKKGGLFKGNNCEVVVYPKKEIVNVIEEYLKEIINNLGIDVNFECMEKEETTVIKMYSDNNPILIGRNGQTLRSLQELVKQMLQSRYGIYYKISLDVENYKERKDQSLEKMAYRLAKDVVRTQSPIYLDNMSSYDRRIIHNALTNFKGVKTESEGEEPNRHVVIKPL